MKILDNGVAFNKTPWKNGYYYNSITTYRIHKFEGNTAVCYSHLHLDFPDLKPMGPPGTITYGNFGPAKEEVQKASGGIKNYNVKICQGKFQIQIESIIQSIHFGLIFYHL